MKKFIAIAFLFGSLFFASNVLASTILNFDDLLTTQNQGGMLWDPMPLNYGGLVWTNWDVDNIATYKSVYNNTLVNNSSTNAVATSTGAMTVTAAAGGTFDFEGAAFSTWAQNNAFASYSASTLTITGWLNGTQVGGDIVINLTTCICY